MPQVYPTIKHYNAVHDEKEKMQQHLHKGLNKFLTSSQIGGDIMDIYPMITNIEVYDLEELIGSIVLRIYVDDSEMTSKNMYEKGLDPHYLIDRHLAKYLPYFSVPKSTKIGFVVIGPDGKTIDSSLG